MAFLAAASVAFALGAAVVGWVLALVVAALAGLAALSGLCVGCEIYVLWVRLRGGVRVVRVDRAVHGSAPARAGAGTAAGSLPEELRAGAPTWVVFTTAYCAVCPAVVDAIGRHRPDDHLVVVDVADEPALAARFSVRRAPTVLRADAEGAVVARLAGADAVLATLDAEGAAVGV